MIQTQTDYLARAREAEFSLLKKGNPGNLPLVVEVVRDSTDRGNYPLPLDLSQMREFAFSPYQKETGIRRVFYRSAEGKALQEALVRITQRACSPDAGDDWQSAPLIRGRNLLRQN